MIKNNKNLKREEKQRLTAFVDPDLVIRAKVRGTLEGLTISEVVEKALEDYAPEIEKGSDRHLNIKFLNGTPIDTLIPQTAAKTVVIPGHTKPVGVPR